MATIDEGERFFRHLVDVLSQSGPDRLKRPMQISEIYQSILPYRHHRSALGFDTSEDYEMAVLRFLSGDGGFASLDPPEAQEALAEEARSINPNPGAFREYAAARIFLNADAVRTVTEAQEAYAPPSPEADDTQLAQPEPSYEDRSPFAPRPDILDLTTAQMPAVEDEPDITTPVEEAVSFAGKACVYCDGQLPAGRVIKFCPFCGRDLRVIACPSCGSELEAGWRYCLTCGDPIGA